MRWQYLIFVRESVTIKSIADSYLPRIEDRIFLLVNLREFVFRFRVRGTKKKKTKALKMTSQLVIFRAFFFFFLISQEQKVKLVK